MKNILITLFCIFSFSAYADKKPVAVINLTPTSGYLPLNVTFDGSASHDEDGTIISYHWDFGDGTTADGPIVSHYFTKKRVENIKLTVTDDSGDSDSEYHVYKFQKDKTSPELSFDVPDDFIVRIATPMITAFYTDETSKVEIEKVLFLLDDVDITNRVVVSEGHAVLQFTNEFPLAVGYHVLKVSVSDYYGNKTSKIISFRLEAQITTNFLNGLVVDTDGVPVPGVEIFAINGPVKSQIHALTDENGNFSATFTTGGEYTLRIAKAGYLEVLKRKVLITGQDNFLDKVTVAVADTKKTYISAQSGGIATNSSGSVSIVIPPGSIPSDLEFSFTEAETGRMLQIPLPNASQFTYAFDAQPSGTTFSTPATMTIDNTLGYPAGAEIAFGIGNESLGIWEDSGYKAVVSEDGAKINFKVPHFSPGDINEPVISDSGNNSKEPQVSDSSQNGDQQNPYGNNGCGSRISSSSCNLSVDHKLPSVLRRGRRFGQILSYSSLSANPHNIITVGTGGQRDVTPPTNVKHYVTLGGQAIEKNYVPSVGVKPSTLVQIYELKNYQNILMGTGSYPFRSEVANRYDNMVYAETPYFGGPPTDPRTGITTREPVFLPEVIYGRSVLNNQVNSIFGAGWELQGWERLYHDADGTITLTDGSGRAKVYTPLTTRAGSPVVQKRVSDEVMNLIYQDGFIYGADCGKNEVFRIDAKGRITTLAGGVFHKKAELSCPTSIYPSKKGGYYVADKGNRRIIYVTKSGDVKTLTNSTKGHIEGPVFVTEDNVMAVHFIDGQEIKTISPHNGEVLTMVGEGPDAIFKYHLKKPTQIHYDEYHNLIVTDQGRNEIIKFYTASGNIRVILKMKGVKALAFDSVLKRYFILNSEGMVYHWKGYGSDRTNLLEVNSATPKLYNPHFPLKKLKKVNSIAFSNEVGLITSIHDGIRFNALDMNSKNLNEVHYLSPIADFSSLIQKADGSFERIMVTKEIYRYNVEGFITEKVFNDGSKITYEYGENNKLLNIHIPGGGAWSFTYEGRGYVESIQDPAGRVTSLRIDNNGDLILITDPRLEMKRYGYDSSHLMVSKFDERGLESNYNYVLGRVNKATYPGGREKFINNTLVNFSQNQLKMAEVPRLPSKDVLTQYVLPGGPKKEVIIDHFGAFRGIVDGRGKTRFVERNENSQPIEEISPAGRKITRSFDLLGRTNSLLDEKGNQNFEYDSVTQKVSSVTDAFGHSKLYSYRPNGQISSYTDKRGMTTYVAYNENNLINNVTDPLNNTTFINRDGSGNISSVVDPLGHGISIERDAAGNPISKSFPEGGADLFEYDEASLLTKITDAVGGSTHISYSPTGKIESIINANNQSTSFLYNEQELISTVINPKGQIENYSYDLDGELIQKVTKSGAAINYILDENKNLISKTFPDEVVSMEYDDDNLLVKATDSDSSFEKRYDNFKRVTEEYQSLSNSYVKYNYSARGLKSKTKLVVDGKVLMDIDHFYDPTGNKSRIIARVSGKSVKVDRNFDEAGRVVGINFPNGGTSSITYDKKSQIKTILSFGTFGSFQSYRYTPNGNVSQYIDKFNSLPKVNRFDYDPANRLVREDSTSLKVYNLDALGNDSSNGGAFNELNQLIQDNNFNYQYDLNGNLSKKTSRFQQKDFAYTWNAENQLLSVQVIETPSQFVLKSLSYKYDPSGRRIERVVIDHKDSSKSYTQRFVYDGDNILAILDGNNEFIIGYIHGQGVDDPLVMVTDYDKDGHLNVLSVIKDMQKSIKVLMDEEMKPVQEITYSAYGEPTIKNIGQGLKVTNNNMLFTSREYEPETGEYYYRARYYDPKAGRFLSEDPIGFQGGDYNLYRYVNNNPIKFTDPSGEQYLYKCDDEDTLSCVFLRVIEEKIIEEIMPKPPKPEPPRPPVSTCNPEVQSCKNEPIKEILDPPKDPGSCE